MNRTPVIEKMLPFLAWETESRGKDSWGVTDGNGGLHKELGPITASWHDPGYAQALFHVRAASTGAISIENQHPFEFRKADGTRVIGVHNGIITNDDELNVKYNRNFAVDSMHIFAHIAEEKDLTELEGWGSIAWFENAELYFAMFNMTALHVWKEEGGGLVFCSTEAPVVKAAKMFGGTLVHYKLEEEKKYKVVVENGAAKLTTIGDMKFGERVASRYENWGRHQGRTYFPAGYAWQMGDEQESHVSYASATDDLSTIGKFARNGGLCLKCRRPTDRKKWVICPGCMSMFANEVKKPWAVLE